MRISEIEMQGLISGKCIPGDMKVNESLPAYLVRKFSELHLQQEATEALMLAMRDDSRESRSKLELITAEFAAMKSGPQGFFTYDSGGSYEEHDTAEAAIKFAEGCIDDYRGDACDGWSDETGSIVWGVIMQRATVTGLRPIDEGDSCAEGITECCDYTLLPNIVTPATDAMVNEIRAEGVELYADATIAIGNAENDEAIIYAGNQALLFANQLRAGAAKDGE